MSRHRNYVFTQNNYGTTDMVDSIDCKYMVYGKEVGESGTPHLQGFVSFKDPKAKSAVIKLMPGCHIDIAKTIHDAITYCKKDGDFTERGTPPMTQQQKGDSNQWSMIYKAAKSGDYESIPDDINMKYARQIDYVCERELKRAKHDTLPELQNEWHYGPTGCGKSRHSRETYPDAYLKMCNKWWDGYKGEEVVLIEDFNIEQAKHLAHHLKLWSDHYPFRAEAKGSCMVIRPKRIIVTSNYSIEHAFGDDTTGSLEPLCRRFKQILYQLSLI